MQMAYGFGGIPRKCNHEQGQLTYQGIHVLSVNKVRHHDILYDPFLHCLGTIT